MKVLTSYTMDELYHRLILDCCASGTPVTPRGQECIELRPAIFQILEPRAGLYRGKTRRLNYRFFAIETLQYLAGWGDKPAHAELLIKSNSNMARFLNEDSGMFDGAYGPRLKQGLQDIYELLLRDPDSRQAVACIWQPGLLNAFEGSRDVPCTLNLHFYKTVNSNGDALGMTASMRSNDLNWGTPYDVGAFCAIQLAMASCLGWRTGVYTHTAGSLHVYTETQPNYMTYPVESFLDYHFLVPQLSWRERDKGYPFQFLRQMCCNYLLQLLNHVCVNNKDWTTFESNLEVSQAEPGSLGYGLAKYFRSWGNMIRFSWKKEDYRAA